MKDINFFEPYIEKKQFKINVEMVYYLLAIVLVVCMILYSFLNQIRINSMQKSINIMKTKIEAEKVQNEIDKLNKKKHEVDEAKSQIENLRRIDESIVSNDNINEFLLQTITSRVSENIFFNSISLNMDSIQIEGIANDRQSVAQFQYSLSNVEGFKKVFISNISLDGKYYRFTLAINLKDVSSDGNENSAEETQPNQNESNEE